VGEYKDLDSHSDKKHNFHLNRMFHRHRLDQGVGMFHSHQGIRSSPHCDSIGMSHLHSMADIHRNRWGKIHNLLRLSFRIQYHRIQVLMEDSRRNPKDTMSRFPGRYMPHPHRRRNQDKYHNPQDTPGNLPIPGKWYHRNGVRRFHNHQGNFHNPHPFLHYRHYHHIYMRKFYNPQDSSLDPHRLHIYCFHRLLGGIGQAYYRPSRYYPMK